MTDAELCATLREIVGDICKRSDARDANTLVAAENAIIITKAAQRIEALLKMGDVALGALRKIDPGLADAQFVREAAGYCEMVMYGTIQEPRT